MIKKILIIFKKLKFNQKKIQKFVSLKIKGVNLTPFY